MWPKKNTAFVVIHGAGAHRPFGVLDKFVRGFWNVLQDANQDLDIRWRHKLQRHGRLATLGREPGTTWIENYVSLAPTGKPALDFYEYYWDCYMDHEIGLTDVIQWCSGISAGAKKFYHDHKELARKHEESGSGLFKDGEFKVGGYFILLGPAGRLLRSLRRLGIARVPVLSSVITLLLSRLLKSIVDLMGDLVIYAQCDARSRNYAIRQKVVGGAVEELGLLLERDDYEQIIVAGHSLGSLIAYDALNRIILDMNAEGGIEPYKGQKIVGLVTFGSPLDKAAFFFREHTRAEEYVRRQTLAHLHGFKSRTLPGDQVPISIDDPIKHHLNQAQWLNFYHLKDPVSGHLDAYEVDENILCDVEVRGSGEAHAVYWFYDQMYEIISDRFFQ